MNPFWCGLPNGYCPRRTRAVRDVSERCSRRCGSNARTPTTAGAGIHDRAVGGGDTEVAGQDVPNGEGESAPCIPTGY